MGDTRAFITLQREMPKKRPVAERVRDWGEVYRRADPALVRLQASRCMDCGIPFCHSGCPLGNLIPDWNDLVCRDHWKDALDALHATNNFPEFTGRLCPAPCEEACVLSINADAVTIKVVEQAIVDRGFAENWIEPEQPAQRTGKTVAIVGSGPAGLAAAQQLNRAGHTVTVLERDDQIGGLLRYGIPDFKMDKALLDRRLEQMRAEGVVFRTGVHVGESISADELRHVFDAVVLTIGSTVPRDLTLPGRELGGIRFAMDYLTRQNRIVAGRLSESDLPELDAGGKNVLIVGGGDTGADCFGTALRQGAKSVTQFQIHPEPPRERPDLNPWWPEPAMILRTAPAHEEGGEREWGIHTTGFTGENGQVTQLRAVRVRPNKGSDDRRGLVPIPGSEVAFDADLVLIAIGYTGPRKTGPVENLGLDLDERGSIVTNADYMTGVRGVFAAGDARRGQSLIVWAIAEGREAAHGVDKYLMGRSSLPLTMYE